jgi:hypothetical protein
MPCQPKDNRPGCVPNIGNGFGVAVFPKDMRGWPAVVRCATAIDEQSWLKAIGRAGTTSAREPEKPDPHTKDNEGEGEHRSRSSHSSHSSGSERSSHSSRDNEWGRFSHGSQHGEASRSEHRGSEDADLSEREYRYEQGSVHDHTRTYMERHKASGTRSNARIKREPRRRLLSVCRRKAWPRSVWGPILGGTRLEVMSNEAVRHRSAGSPGRG